MRFLVTLSLLLALTACGGGSVAGKYSLDTAAVKAAMMKAGGADADKLPADQKKQMEEMMNKMVEAMKCDMTLGADGTFECVMEMPMVGKSSIKGTYKVDGDKITMTGKEQGKADAKEETKSGTISGSTITMTEEEGGQKMTMVFKKS
ncbi:MAG: hypothetical protein U1F36_13720 [Planctomycetota bacterium]